MTRFGPYTPGVVRRLDTRSGLMVEPREEREYPSVPDILGAAFQTQNIIGSLIANSAPEMVDTGTPIDPFELQDPTRRHSVRDNPMKHLAGYEDFLSEFVGATTLGKVERVKRDIQRELRNRQVLADAGFWGFASQVAAGVMDPLIFVPGAGVAWKARGAVSIGRTALRSAGLGAGIVGVQEAALHATQRSRTPAESAISITGGAVLSGILGAAVGKLTANQVARAAADLEAIVQTTEAPRPPAEVPGPVAGETVPVPIIERPPATPANVDPPQVDLATGPPPVAAAAPEAPVPSTMAWRALQALARKLRINQFQKRPALERAVAEAQSRPPTPEEPPTPTAPPEPAAAPVAEAPPAPAGPVVPIPMPDLPPAVLQHQRKTPAKGTLERDAWEKQWEAAQEGLDAAHKGKIAAAADLNRRKPGSKAQDAAGKRMDAAREADHQAARVYEEVRHRVRAAFLEDVIADPEAHPLNRIEARIELRSSEIPEAYRAAPKGEDAADLGAASDAVAKSTLASHGIAEEAMSSALLRGEVSQRLNRSAPKAIDDYMHIERHRTVNREAEKLIRELPMHERTRSGFLRRLPAHQDDLPKIIEEARAMSVKFQESVAADEAATKAQAGANTRQIVPDLPKATVTSLTSKFGGNVIGEGDIAGAGAYAVDTSQVKSGDAAKLKDTRGGEQKLTQEQARGVVDDVAKSAALRSEARLLGRWENMAIIDTGADEPLFVNAMILSYLRRILGTGVTMKVGQQTFRTGKTMPVLVLYKDGRVAAILAALNSSGPVGGIDLALARQLATGKNALAATTDQVISGAAPDPMAPGGIDPRGFPGIKALDSTSTAVDVAEAAGVGLAKASFFGIDFLKVAKFINPRLQIGLSRLGLTRSQGERLIEIPVRRAGDAVPPTSAEVVTRVRRSEARLVMKQVLDLFVRHLTGDPKATVRTRHVMFGFGGAKGKLTERQFFMEIARAMRGQAGPEGKAVNFDMHPIPEVETAARLIRAKIVNPIRDELIALGVLPKDVLEFPGYLTRLYNRELLRTTKLDPTGKKITFPEREAFIDSIIAYEAKLAALRGTLDEFNEARLRARLGKVVDQIVAIPDGRLHPGDLPFRGPMLERTLKVPDQVIERWLNNDTERIVAYYVRALVGDAEIIKRFGLVVQRDAIEAAQPGIVQAVREAKDVAAASKVIREFRKELSSNQGGRQFKRTMAVGSRRRGVMNPRSLAEMLRGENLTEAQALKLLQKHDERMMYEFSTGNMELLLDRVESAWNRRVKGVERSSSKAANRYRKQRNNDLANLKLGRDEIRGMATLPDDPTAFFPRALRSLRMWSVMAMGGKIALSSIPDLSMAALNHGLVDPRGFGKALGGMMGDMDSLALARADADLALGPSEIISNSRTARLMDIEEDFLPHTKFERGLTKAVHKFSLLNLMAPWNQAMRNLSAYTVQTLIVRSARRVAAGEKLEPGVVGRLAELGLGESMLRRIAAQRSKAVGPGGRIPDMVLRLDRWTDEEAARATKVASYRAYDLNVIKGSVLDRPKFLRQAVPGLGDELSKVVFFFLNFGLAANLRVLGRGLQFKDAAFVSGATLSVGLGMVGQWLKWKASGQKDPPYENLAGWVRGGVEQSGISGFIFDVDRVLDQVTGGRITMSRIVPGRASRFYTPQTTIEALFGLPAGQVVSAGWLLGDVMDLDVEPADVRRLRRLIPLNNHFAASRAFDAIQKKGERAAR